MIERQTGREGVGKVYVCVYEREREKEREREMVKKDRIDIERETNSRRTNGEIGAQLHYISNHKYEN